MVDQSPASAPVIYLPTREACDAYGIPRSGTSSRNIGAKGAPFLRGPQFNKIKINNPAGAGVGDESDPRIDEIKLEFIGNQPYKLEFNPNQNGIQTASFVGGKDDSSILDVYIAPNTTDWINFTSKHTWDKPGGIITSLFESVTSLLNAGNGILTKIVNASQAGSGTDLKREQNISMDQADSYQKSDSVEFTIPFLLWSAGSSVEDWIRDIYLPVMLLTAWSYPRRAKQLSALEQTQVLNEADAASKKQSEDVTVGIQNTINKIYPGIRIVLSDPPSYVRVSHMSGLFTFNRCAITSFNFKYMDPWVKATIDPNSNLNEMSESLLKKSLPMRAECSITLRSIERLYADDWISMYTSGLDIMSKGSTTGVSVITTSQNTNRPQTTPSNPQ